MAHEEGRGPVIRDQRLMGVGEFLEGFSIFPFHFILSFHFSIFFFTHLSSLSPSFHFSAFGRPFELEWGGV